MDEFASPVHEPPLFSRPPLRETASWIGLLLLLQLLAAPYTLAMALSWKGLAGLVPALVCLVAPGILWSLARGRSRPDDSILWIVAEIGAASALFPTPILLLVAVTDGVRWATGTPLGNGEVMTVSRLASAAGGLWLMFAALSAVPTAAGAVPVALARSGAFARRDTKDPPTSSGSTGD